MKTQGSIFFRSVITLSAATFFGWLCDRAGLPLGWVIGPTLVVSVASLLGFKVEQPSAAMPATRASIGAMLGASFSMDLVLSIPAWWSSLASLIVALCVSCLLCFGLLRYIFRFRTASAVLCSVPGGIAEMLLLSDSAGADNRQVAIVHALRIALTILILPVLIHWYFDIEVLRKESVDVAGMSNSDWGWFLFCIATGLLAQKFTRIPLPLILIPMLVSIALHISGVSLFQVPMFITILIQVLIGITVGARFRGVSASYLYKVLKAAVMVVFVQISIAFCAASLVTNIGHGEPLTLVLAFAPGGLAEMSLIALAMGRDVAFVGLHHLFRVFLALGLAPLMLSAATRVER